MSDVKRPAVVATALVAVAAITAACGGGTEATGHDQPAETGPLHIGVLYETADPHTLITPIAEGTTDTTSVCWVTYDIAATTKGDHIELRETMRINSPPSGTSCATGAVPAYQHVHLPTAYHGQQILDAADGDPIPVRRLTGPQATATTPSSATEVRCALRGTTRTV